jgi:hypothetical protein
VISKEFAAAPLWIYALLSALRRRWDTALQAALGALTATLVWFALQTALMTLYNYSYGNNPSVNLLTGAYFAVWTDALGWPRAIASLFMAFGPLFVLLPAAGSAPIARFACWPSPRCRRWRRSCTCSNPIARCGTFISR